MSDDEYVSQELMSGNRGHFAAALADAWSRADSSNKAKLEAAFEDIFNPRMTNCINVRIDFAGRRDCEVVQYDQENLRAVVQNHLEGLADHCDMQIKVTLA